MSGPQNEVQIVEVGPCCANCKFFLGTEQDQGVCRIKPPVGHVIQNGAQAGQVMSFSPPVQASGWCGQFLHVNWPDSPAPLPFPMA